MTKILTMDNSSINYNYIVIFCCEVIKKILLQLDEVRSGRGKKGKWILAMEVLSNNSKIVISTTNRELCKIFILIA